MLAPKIAVKSKVGYYDLLKHNEIGLLTAMYHVAQTGKRYFKSIGHEDFAYWLQILKEGYASYGLNNTLASYRVRRHSLSHNKLKAAGYTWYIYRNEEKLPIFMCLFYFSCYAIHAGLKFMKR
ncbi:putative teichuronic acid biosynthesis glycosyltransferase TuaG [compost metagenome]